MSAFPVNAPTKDVAVSAPVLELYVRDVDDFGPKSPVAAVANKTLHVVSVASLAMVIVPGTILADPLKDTPPMLRAVANVVAVSAFPVSAPTNVVAFTVLSKVALKS